MSEGFIRGHPPRHIDSLTQQFGLFRSMQLLIDIRLSQVCPHISTDTLENQFPYEMLLASIPYTVKDPVPGI